MTAPRHPRRAPSAFVRALLGVLAGVAVSMPLVALVECAVPARPAFRLVAEDASGRLRRVAIHYAPAMDAEVMPVWQKLFAQLPPDVAVAVAVAKAPDFERFLRAMRAAAIDVARFEPVVVGRALTTWSRDRLAALVGPAGEGAVLAPPRTASATVARAGDWQAPFALAHALYRSEAHVADFVFEGGDLAASRHRVFADANLVTHNLGRGDASRAHLEAALAGTFAQDVIWLGDAPGEVPEHHIMMYLVPLDDDAVAVGDVRLGAELLAGESGERAPEDGRQALAVDPDVERYARRFDRAAELAAAQGLRVERLPVVVLAGGGSYVTYTNALFDRDDAGPVVYLPTYRLPRLDDYARAAYAALGYRVEPIDVSSVYQLNGSLGCLVNVLARE